VTPEEAIEEMVRISEEFDLYGEPVTVCIAHARFIPCRKDDGCVFSSEMADIAKVRVIQGITAADLRILMVCPKKSLPT
jgi:hypothetical protein